MDESKIQVRFIDYIHSMFEHIKYAYGNPPVIVNLHAPLRDAVMEGVPPADIGEQWFNIALYVFINNVKWDYDSPDVDASRVYPSPEMMEQWVINNWSA